jgi:hypothetical protein
LYKKKKKQEKKRHEIQTSNDYISKKSLQTDSTYPFQRPGPQKFAFEIKDLRKKKKEKKGKKKNSKAVLFGGFSNLVGWQTRRELSV